MIPKHSGLITPDDAGPEMLKSPWGITLLFCLGILFPSLHAKDSPLRFCAWEQSPFIFNDRGKGESKGIAAELMKRLIKETGFSMNQISLYPVNRCLAYVEAGKMDGVLFMQKQEEADLVFPKTSLFKIPNRLFYLKSAFPEGIQWLSPQHLQGKKIGVFSGNKLSESFKEAAEKGAFQIIRLKKIDAHYQKLQRGSIDMILDNEITGYVSLEEAGMDPTDITASFKPESITEYYFGLGKQLHRDSPEILEKLEKALLALHHDGFVKKLYLKSRL